MNDSDPGYSEGKPVTYGITDHELALSFVEKHGGALRYVPKWDVWFRWTGTHWKKLETKDNFDLVRKHVVEIGNRLNKGKKREELLSSRKTAAVERFVKNDPRIGVETGVWDQHPYLLNTPSGTIDLLTGMMRPHDPADLLTQITAVAPAEMADCPQFLAFLNQIMSERGDVIAYIQRFFGYCLSGDTSEQALAFGYGLGNNGKSLLINLISFVMGDYHRRTSVDTFTLKPHEQHPTAIADLNGARLVSAVETKKNRAWDESVITEMTGEDSVKGRFMHKDFFLITVTWKIFIIGNHKPRLNSTGKAIRRRLQLWPFTVTIADNAVDRKLFNKLKQEAPGILRWAIEGFKRWRTEGLTPPGFVVDATKDYIEDQDLISMWLDECCVEEANVWASTIELHRAFTRWGRDRNIDDVWVNTFSSMLEEKGFERSRPRVDKEKVRGFKGLRLANQTDDPQEDFGV